MLRSGSGRSWYRFAWLRTNPAASYHSHLLDIGVGKKEADRKILGQLAGETRYGLQESATPQRVPWCR